MVSDDVDGLDTSAYKFEPSVPSSVRVGERDGSRFASENMKWRSLHHSPHGKAAHSVLVHVQDR